MKLDIYIKKFHEYIYEHDIEELGSAVLFSEKDDSFVLVEGELAEMVSKSVMQSDLHRDYERIGDVIADQWVTPPTEEGRDFMVYVLYAHQGELLVPVHMSSVSIRYDVSVDALPAWEAIRMYKDG